MKTYKQWKQTWTCGNTGHSNRPTLLVASLAAYNYLPLLSYATLLAA